MVSLHTANVSCSHIEGSSSERHTAGILPHDSLLHWFCQQWQLAAIYLVAAVTGSINKGSLWPVAKVVNAHLLQMVAKLHVTLLLLQVGNSASAADLQCVRDHMALHRHTHLVKPDWLRLCHHERKCVPADKRCSISIEATLVRTGSQHPAAGGSALLNTGGYSNHGAPGGVFSNVASRMLPPDSRSGGALADSAGPPAPEYWLDAPADPHRLFADCWFTLVAVKGTQHDKKAEDLIRCVQSAVLVQVLTGPLHALSGCRL